MSKPLRIALLHAAIAYGKVDENRQALLDMISRAAGAGAELIVAPEMALSGYSFDSREAIAPFVETIDGPTVNAVGELARLHGVYVCVGLALEEPQTGIFHNSAVVVEPPARWPAVMIKSTPKAVGPAREMPGRTTRLKRLGDASAF